ncbi:yippee-like protein [Podospora conica]|nr:yippee-like protein [Schizothecium conicum]
MFGVGDLTVFARPVVAAPVDKGPTFPLFLLPTFNIPFRRRRPQDDYFDTQPESPSESSVPSLSSSPDSLSGAETPDSPISLRPFLTKFPALGDSHHEKANARKRRLLPFLNGPRLARTQPDTIRCSTCATDIAFSSQIVSKGFTGRHGRAFLIAPPSPAHDVAAPTSPSADLLNITIGRPETRQLVTGLHSVADIWCAVCGTKIGWKYVDAREPAQKYKIGKFILETARVALHQTWEDVGGHPSGAAAVHKDQDDAAQHRGTRNTSAGSSGRSSSETNTDTTASGGSSGYLHDEDDDVVVFDSEDEDECDDIFAGVWDAETVVRRRRSRVAQTRKRR